MAIVKKSKDARKIRLLFVDSRNDQSSQLAEFYTKQLYSDIYEAYSAGPEHDIIDCDLLSALYRKGDDLRNMVSKDFRDTKRLPEDADYDFIIWTEKEIFDEIHADSPWEGKQILADMGKRSEFDAQDDVDLDKCFCDMADRIRAWVKENLADPGNLPKLVIA